MKKRRVGVSVKKVDSVRRGGLTIDKTFEDKFVKKKKWVPKKWSSSIGFGLKLISSVLMEVKVEVISITPKTQNGNFHFHFHFSPFQFHPTKGAQS